MATSTSPTMYKPVFHWDQRDVETFLKDNKEKYFLNDEAIGLIVGQEICGSSLLELTRDDLDRCGMKVRHALSILRVIRELKQMRDVREPCKCNLDSFSNYAYLLTVLSLL